MRRKALVVVTSLVLAAGLVQSGKALMIPAKAWLAGHLIEQAWAQTLAGTADAKPWPWMDSSPVAEITFVRQDKKFVVMKGTSGTVLAFAPGWHEGSDAPGQPGISLISAHRDTHFGFLNELKTGDRIMIRTVDGIKKTYAVDEMKIVMDPEIKVHRDERDSTLLLSTCFPFVNWQPGGEMRFVVVAREVQGGEVLS
ncbi:MAG: class GN sortase [Rhodospirillales bacterium]|nr:class GN sortase [Rhodospirillales bacterium]MCB9994968.1 class GN sortase [Rhodospirillales bacterium]